MKNKILSLATFSVLLVSTSNLMGQNQTEKKQNEMEQENTSQMVVQAFFNAFGTGDYEGVINSFHTNCKIIAVREGERNDNQLYGTYLGTEGAKTFISNLGTTFDTKAFNVEHVIGADNVAFANGTFTHVVKSTGKTFTSSWSLMCIIQDHKILEYHFYEDSASFMEANN